MQSAPYRAFFKSSHYEILVEHFLEDISVGAAIRLAASRPLLTPHIVCALQNDTIIFPSSAGQNIDVYQVCQSDRSRTVIYYPEQSDIFICKRFFELPAQPSAGNCPKVNKVTNRFEGNYAAFWISQMYFLLHEIAQFYVGLSIEERFEESTDGIHGWNYAYSLSPVNASFSAINYVLYVASGYTFISSCG